MGAAGVCTALLVLVGATVGVLAPDRSWAGELRSAAMAGPDCSGPGAAPAPVDAAAPSACPAPGPPSVASGVVATGAVTTGAPAAGAPAAGAVPGFPAGAVRPASPWRPVGALELSQARGADWSTVLVGMEREAAGGWQATRAEFALARRPGLADRQATLVLSGPEGWQAEIRAAPQAAALARAGVRVARTGQIRTGTLTIVPGLGVEVRHWPAGTLAALAPSVEIYPASGRWRSAAGAQVGAFGGQAVGGGFASVAAPVRRGVELQLLVGAGREVDAGRVLRTRTAAAAVAVALPGGQRLQLGLMRESRSGGWVRDGVDLRLGRSF